MEPLPGPSLMLPALDLSGSPDLDPHTTFKLREAEWKRLISSLHKEWCLCGSYINHFILPENSLQQCTVDAGRDTAGAGTSGGGGDISGRGDDVDGDPEDG
nr:ORF2 [Torque teno felis virus]